MAMGKADKLGGSSPIGEPKRNTFFVRTKWFLAWERKNWRM